LVFTYENPEIYKCYPSNAFEHESVYLYGQHLDKIQYIFLGGDRVPFKLDNPTSIHILTPPGEGVKTFVFVDQNGNMIKTNITLSYLRLESVICFPAGTKVYADQGVTEIQDLYPGLQTIYGKEIKLITDTYSIDKELVCIEKNAFYDYPNERTLISKHHKIFYQGKMIEAMWFVGKIAGASYVPYDGRKLYNVLLEESGRMNVQGMICETLNPTNPIISMFKRKLTAIPY
jgi:hypothetical protein